MTNQPDVSIIVPVYNVEKYLPECIESLVNQTHKNIEIILIDDGSTDLSSQICDQYAEADKRIKVIHKKNERQHKARIAGLQVTTAPYVTFCDADDYFAINAIELLYTEIKEKISDMVFPAKGIFLYKNKEKMVKSIFIEKETIFNKEQFPIKMRGLCGKLYKKETIKKCLEDIPSFKDHEDFPVFTYYLSKINNISVIDSSIYYYRQRKTSWSHSFFNDINGISDLWKYYNKNLVNFVKPEDLDYLKRILWNDGIKITAYSGNSREMKNNLQSLLGEFQIKKKFSVGKIRDLLFFYNLFFLLRYIFKFRYFFQNISLFE